VVAISEIDKYAIKSYEAIHGQANNLGDICSIEQLPYADLVTYSFPCQDISVAGKQAGLSKGGGTRSGLLWEVERLLIKAKESNTLPKYLLLENVKNLVGKKFIDGFKSWISILDELGYKTYWQVLNAKNYGIPQNRERVFAVSIRKDTDNGYEFPEGFDNGLRLKDFLEDEVDEKYYISSDKVEKLLNSSFVQEKNRIQTKDICDCLLSRDYKSPKCVLMLTPDRVEKRHYRIRKLTPRECYRLMGFSDEAFDKAKAAGISDSQLYKQAGNSIVVKVLEKKFKNLFKGDARK
jgi:DNA (cytosine-5)-methyltransferase 1